MKDLVAIPLESLGQVVAYQYTENGLPVKALASWIGETVDVWARLKPEVVLRAVRMEQLRGRFLVAYQAQTGPAPEGLILCKCFDLTHPTNIAIRNLVDAIADKKGITQ